MIPHSRPTLDQTDRSVVAEVMRSGFIAQGEKVQEFEKALASYVGVKGGVGVSSGTAALHLALLALDVREADEVIVPTYVCTAPVNAVYYTGATPVLADIAQDDLNISASDVKTKLTGRTKAIIVPHMFGAPAADMEEILSIGMPVIEDCAHSIGATYPGLEPQSRGVAREAVNCREPSDGQMVGSIGVLSIFSFYPTKMLAAGEGGMVVSRDKRLLSRIRDLRDYDERDEFRTRFNYKMTDIEAALGLNQLEKLPEFIRRRKAIAEKYNAAFSGCGFDTPRIDEGYVLYRYVIRIRKNVENYLKRISDKGVDCRKPVYKPIHQYFGLKDFPVAERVHGSAVSIPMYPSLTDEEVDFVAEAVTSIDQ
jgi:dTDP-4-amino-4,6-dideoxygalactose transaminase